MSVKNRDAHGRWRNKTVSFRISPEENERLNQLVALSGLSKQEYLTRRVLDREVVISGNPRVFKTLKKEILQMAKELERISQASEMDEPMRETLQTVTAICSRMMNEQVSRTGGFQNGKVR